MTSKTIAEIAQRYAVWLGLVAGIATTGCGSTSLGVRAGADIPLESIEVNGGEHVALESESHSVAPGIGVAFRQNAFGSIVLLLEPSVSFGHTDRTVLRQESMEAPQPGHYTVEIETSHTSLDIPFHVAYTLPFDGTRESTRWNLLLGLGARLSRTLPKYELNALSYRVAEDGARDSEESTTGGGRRTTLFASALAGLDWKMDERWTFSFDLRYQHSVGDGYSLDSPIEVNDHEEYYRLRSPIQYLALSLSVLMRL